MLLRSRVLMSTVLCMSCDELDVSLSFLSMRNNVCI